MQYFLLCVWVLAHKAHLTYNDSIVSYLCTANQKGSVNMAAYKCIIIDDEPLICQLIYKLGNWEEFDIEVAAICYDGESALNEIIKHNPDIVFSDIKVPIHNGIEIIELVHEAGLYPLFVIISGYSEFEYAQKAIRLKAVDYLVKPIRKDKLNDALLRCCDMLAQESKHLATSKALEDAQAELLWNDLHNGKYNCLTAEDFLAKYGAVWTDRTHYAAAISVSRPELSEHHALYIDRVLSIFADTFQKLTYSCSSTSGCIYLCFSTDKKKYHEITDCFQKLFIDIKHLEETLNYFSLTIGYSKPFLKPDGYPLALKQAQTASFYRFEKGANAIYSYSQLPAVSYSYKNLINDTFAKNIIYYTYALDTEQLKELLSEFKNKFLSHPDRDFAGLMEFCINFLNMVMNTAQVPEQEVLREKFLFDYQYCITYDNVFDLLENCILNIINKKKEAEAVELSSSVRAAQNYIDEHYAEKIYLDDIAKAVLLSASYLSAIFKKESGITVTDYINSVRCNAAKELLKTTPLSLPAIAEQVGYSDEKYFQHSFKKFVGITPAQFRRIYT